jgi:hypothetical protein
MRVSSPAALRRSLDAARECLAEERRRTTVELRALESFVDEVRAFSTESVSFDAGRATVIRSTRAHRGAGGTDALREAYESTLMDVAHYDVEFGDTYVESVAEEFGPGVATALVERDALDDQLKSAVLSAAREAQASREALLEAVDTEAESLDAAQERLQPVLEELSEFAAESLSERNFETLDAYRARLGVLADRCEDVAADRQDTLRAQRHGLWLPVEGPDVPTYAYQSLEVDYPVLAAATAVAERVESVRADVERAMGYCN